jgi:hypothetical protein
LQGVTISPDQKLMMNSFAKRNFMQPMGRRKHVCVAFFVIFLFFPMCSHYVPLKFPMCFHYVPNGFPSGFSNIFSIAPHVYPICFVKCCPPFTYILGPKGENSMFKKIALSILGSFQDKEFILLKKTLQTKKKFSYKVANYSKQQR